MSATTRSDPRPQPKGEAAPEPTPGPGADPSPDEVRGALNAHCKRLASARGAAGDAEVEFASALTAAGYTARRKRAFPGPDGRLYQVVGEKVVALGT